MKHTPLTRKTSLKAKPRKCLEKAEGCEGEYWPRSNQLWRCCFNYKCIAQKAERERAKQAARKRAILTQEKREAKERLKTRRDYLREAQAIFNGYIRERDKNRPCISCGRFHSGQYHAGHFQTVAARPDLRFCEIQVHRQCAPCNSHLSGNITAYRQSLVTILGEPWVEQIESGPRGRSDWSIEEIKEIAAHYRAETKRLKAEGLG